MRVCRVCHVLYATAEGNFHKAGQGFRGDCVSCFRAKAKKRRLTPQHQATRKAWRTKNKECIKSANVRYHKEDYAKNRGRIIQKSRSRRRLTGIHTPPWLTKAQQDQIEAFYRRARQLTQMTGVLYHVDHIHPLKGVNFCGLHVPWNLQVITQAENDAKGNRLIGTV